MRCVDAAKSVLPPFVQHTGESPCNYRQAHYFSTTCWLPSCVRPYALSAPICLGIVALLYTTLPRGKSSAAVLLRAGICRQIVASD